MRRGEVLTGGTALVVGALVGGLEPLAAATGKEASMTELSASLKTCVQELKRI